MGKNGGVVDLWGDLFTGGDKLPQRSISSLGQTTPEVDFLSAKIRFYNSSIESTSFLVSYQLWKEISILLTVIVPNDLGFSMKSKSFSEF